MLNAFGNLVSNDLVLIKESANKEMIDYYNDPYLVKSQFIMDYNGKKQIINGQTAFLDLSPVYGQDEETTEKLRT
jgi:hypothetical protein